MIDIDYKLFEKAYKKLKSSIYFDKTQLVLRDQLVKFEMEIGDIRKYFKKLRQQFCISKEYEKLEKEILDSISYLVFPKKIETQGTNSGEGAITNSSDAKEKKYTECKMKKHDVISNAVPQATEICDVQYFINMDIRGHILGVLWLMLIGYKLDKKFYEHSYGNRIRKNLHNEFSESPTYSPYLFEPYFQQYESWRDMGLDEATRQLADNHDVIVMTLDFKRFYYSVDLQENAFKEIFKSANFDDTENNALVSRINDFAYKVIMKYSSCFADRFERRHFLPIGFLPSNVLANWSLANFDKAIVEGWNPVYYGRYVDDILIVDKVESGSDIYERAQEGQLSKNDAIGFFMLQCTKWRGINTAGLIGGDNNPYPLFCKAEAESQNPIYYVNGHYNPWPDDNSRIELQNDKIKIFYFKSGESTSLIQCFRKEISKNKSEFRHMPQDEEFFTDDDYSEIYRLSMDDSPNKLRGVDGISIDKYELSKFLSRNTKIGAMIEDGIESKFRRDLLRIFSSKVIIENYTTWERLIEVFTIEEQYESVDTLITKIIKCIHDLKLIEGDEYCKGESTKLRHTLYTFLFSAIYRASALVWKRECHLKYVELCKKILKEIGTPPESDDKISASVFEMREAYCSARMLNKSVMPIIYDMLDIRIAKKEDIGVNLTRFKEVIIHIKNKWNSDYIFHPSLISMSDFSIIFCLERLQKTTEAEAINWEDSNRTAIKAFSMTNYNLGNEPSTFGVLSLDDLIEVKDVTASFISTKEKKVLDSKRIFNISVGDSKKPKLKLGIANTRIDQDNFKRLVHNTPNRRYDRYKKIAQMVNQAIDEEVDMLIMPESCVPFEWLSFLAKYSASNQFVIITGVEHLILKNRVYNLTATILPYIDNNHRCASIFFHLKNHYAPPETNQINKYRYKEVAGNSYELFRWNDCYFPVYCCYELASVYDRSIFQSYADMLVAVEWNKDVNYFSSIIESLSRDVHCYCVQVNSSDYGDSRIVRPMKTDYRDLIKTKGGINSTILVDYIDIASLREFQVGENTTDGTADGKDMFFKVTPPGFNKEIPLKKIKGERLFD